MRVSHESWIYLRMADHMLASRLRQNAMPAAR